MGVFGTLSIRQQILQVGSIRIRVCIVGDQLVVEVEINTAEQTMKQVVDERDF